MALPQYTATTYFNTGTISARALQTNFGGNSNDIKFSTYRRNTNQDETNPVVPDADENANISTLNNLSAESFRGSVKQLTATQSGNDTDLDLDTSTIWGSNLNKNVIKNLSITGRIIASSNTTNAAAFDAEVYNLRVDVSGQIYGQGGNASSANGGSALYLNNTTTRSGASRTINVNVNATGRIWAGGGYGTSGVNGNRGPSLNCFQNTNYSVFANFGDNRGWYNNQANQTCANNVPSGYQDGYSLYGNPNDTRSRCRGGGYRRGDGWNAANRTGYACSPTWTITCQAIQYFNVTGGAGGTGGDPGLGAGWNTRGSWGTNYPLNAGEFNSANIGGGSPNTNPGTNNCAGNGTSSVGNAAAVGNSGGQWGSAGAGGNAGAAISGSLYKVVSGDTGVGHLQRIKGTK